jgi:hypothetical protein
MFEVTSGEISQLDDSQLRELVARLCAVELAAAALPRSAVRWGGNQRAGDGGIDVRVDLDTALSGLDFVPRAQTGFQVKQEKAFGPAEVKVEMAPKGQPRPVLQELADAGGAYVIVNGSKSLADMPLKNRLAAMRSVADELRGGGRLELDFYDGNGIADWVNRHPGIVLWVLEKLGRGHSGYRPYGNWTAAPETAFIDDPSERLLDLTKAGAEPLALVPGIKRLRDALRAEESCVRVMGLSGTGKTRLAQALFDEAVGGEALPTDFAVYVDTADEPRPPVREVLALLVARGQRAVLVVDNCAKDMHRSLSKELRRSPSRISLLTIEYDIREDESDETDVFQLLRGSNDLIDTLLQHRASQLSLLDRQRLVEWSMGNARLALALARRVGKGESLSQLTDQQLFTRLFDQQQGKNRDLLKAGEVAALAYSFDVETADGVEAERPLLAAMAEQTSAAFYGHIEELRKRDLVQRRGRWRAVLPPALAHHLAKAALENLPPEDLASFLGDAPPRLLKSFARQLGHLHDSERARAIVRSWLARGGLLGDYARLCDDRKAMFRFVAPVEPETTFAAIERSLTELLSTPKAFFDDPLRDLARLLRWLAHDPALFERVLEQLVRILVARDDDPTTAEHFSELFWLTLSGTHAGPEVRLAEVERLLGSEDERRQRLGLMALNAMLKASDFTSFNLGTIGALPWSPGWRPTTGQQVADWYASVLARLKRLLLTEGPVASEARAVLAKRFADLWYRTPVADDLERVMRVAGRDEFWPGGYIAVCDALARKKAKEGAIADQRLAKLRDAMQPRDLVERVRVFALPERDRPIDWAEIESAASGEPMDAYRAADRRAFELGEALTDDAAAFAALLPELVRSLSPRVWSLGKGMARAATEPEVFWRSMVTALAEVEPEGRRLHLPMGFLVELQEHEPLLVGCILDDAIADATLAPHFAQLQAAVPVDKAGVQRLRLSLDLGLAPLATFERLAYERATDTIDCDDLVELIEAIARRPDGYLIAVHILSLRSFSDLRSGRPSIDAQLIACGRRLLLVLPLDFDSDIQDERVTGLDLVAKVCLKGAEAEKTARALCLRLLETDGEAFQRWSMYAQLVRTIFEAQPHVALDELADPHLIEEKIRFSPDLEDVIRQQIDKVCESDLLGWLEIDPNVRYLRLAGIITLLQTDDVDDEALLSPAAIALIRHAPDRSAVLGALEVFPPSYGFSGSAATFFGQCRTLVRELEDPKDAALMTWLRMVDQKLARKVEQSRTRVRESEERFED